MDVDLLKQRKLELGLTNQQLSSPSAYQPYIEQKENGNYTVDDYCAIPEDVRAELIDGFLIFNETPTVTHQGILSELNYYFAHYIKKKKGPCKVYQSPIGVRLDNDNKTMLEPDLIILCDTSKSDGHHINGAPDFVCEVVSPGSRSRDYMIKLNKYYYAGVREYWVIDEKLKTVSVYRFDKSVDNFDLITYTFDAQIPVGIFDDLVIDFKELDF